MKQKKTRGVSVYIHRQGAYGLDTYSGTGLLPKFNRNILVQGYVCNKNFHENPITLSGDMNQIVKKIPYLAVLKNPSKIPGSRSGGE